MKPTPKHYEAIDFPPLTEEQRAEIECIENLPDAMIDCSDIPECEGGGGFYYVQSQDAQKTTIRTAIDNDTLAWLKRRGRGYQKRLNEVLAWAKLNGCPLA